MLVSCEYLRIFYVIFQFVYFVRTKYQFWCQITWYLNAFRIILLHCVTCLKQSLKLPENRTSHFVVHLAFILLWFCPNWFTDDNSDVLDSRIETTQRLCSETEPQDTKVFFQHTNFKFGGNLIISLWILMTFLF
jgi:hypothetical protein